LCDLLKALDMPLKDELQYNMYNKDFKLFEKQIQIHC
ncbi:hypothetical protein T4C_8070, partial [Trichinella pseudospiralis]